MEGEIFDFDPVNEPSVDESKVNNEYANRANDEGANDTQADCVGNTDTRYPLANMLGHEFADEERQERNEHDYNAFQEGNILDYLNDRKDGDGEEDEETYDKYVPTDQGVVDEYLKRLQMEGVDGDGKEVNFKAKHIVRSENDSGKIRFSKSIIGMYVPPENFARVCEGIYRSSFPRIENFQFLKSLGLRSILCLIPEEYPIENTKFNESNGIKFYQIGLSGNKEPFVKIKPELVTEAIKILISPENQPILLHCNRGKHRTGCIVGCIRKLQKWSHSMIFDEYRKFAYPKERPLDQQFIEMYNGQEVEDFAVQNRLLPIQW